MVAAACDPGGEAHVASLLGGRRLLCTVPSSRPAAPGPDLLPLPAGVGFLPGFDNVKKNVSLRSAVDTINDLGNRGIPLRGTPTSVQRLALAGVALHFSSLPEGLVGVTVQDAITHSRPGRRTSDMATRKPALFRRGWVSLPCVQVGLVPLSPVVPPNVRFMLEDDAASPILQRDCKERFAGKHAFDARLRVNPR